MTLQEFISSLSANKPPEQITPYLQAMWYDKKNDWEKAHEIIQDIDNSNGSWIHAYLHRKEGDNGNAGYWYRKAGKPIPSVTLEKEWEDIVKSFL